MPMPMSQNLPMNTEIIAQLCISTINSTPLRYPCLIDLDRCIEDLDTNGVD
jgi:hypothetical protein